MMKASKKDVDIGANAAIGDVTECYRQLVVETPRIRLVELDPKNARARRELGVSYFKVGDGYAEMAERAKGAQNRAHWRESRRWFVRSLDVFLALRDEDLLGAADAGTPTEIEQQIARCDGALARLEG